MRTLTTIEFVNIIESEATTYYASDYTTALEFTRQKRRELKEAGWTGGRDYTFHIEDDVEIEDEEFDAEYEHDPRDPWGIYKRID